MDRLVRAVLGDWASEYGAVGVAVRAITAEGLIGCKLQALVNNPDRARDLDDIRALLLAQRGRLDMDEVREYFALFDREALLDKLLAQADVDGS